MKLFRKKQASSLDDGRAKRIAEVIIYRQTQMAVYLNQKLANISGRTLLLLLIVFGAAFGSYCLYLVLGAF